MGTIVVTGAASGIGAATASRLREDGHRVIGVDRAPADVTVDLSTVAGRSAALEQIVALATDGISGVVPCAGIGGFTDTDPADVVSLNHFGDVELCAALRPLLVDAAAVVLLSSNSVTCQPGWAREVADLCLAGDEVRAREAAAAHDAVQVYPATKAALAWWARRESLSFRDRPPGAARGSGRGHRVPAFRARPADRRHHGHRGRRHGGDAVSHWGMSADGVSLPCQ